MPSTRAGSHMWRRFATGSVVNGVKSAEGRQFHQIAGSTITRVASQKPGTDRPRIATLRASRSPRLSWRTAAMMPTGSAISSEMASAMSASSSVIGSRWPISSSTGRFVHSDSPRSPRTARPAHSTYCTCSGRFRPSLARSSSMSLAYAFSSSMSWTASPGMRRGRANTTTDAISSDGIAMKSRLTMYRRSMAQRRGTRKPRSPADPTLPVEPGGQQATAVVVADIGPVVLEGGVPDGDVDRRRQLHVVLLPGQVLLDLEDHLAALGDVERAPLAHQQVGHLRVVDVALVARLPREVLAVEERIGLQERRLRPERARGELAIEARGDVGAVLLLVEGRVDPHVLEVLEDDLRLVDQDGRPVRGEAE